LIGLRRIKRTERYDFESNFKRAFAFWLAKRLRIYALVNVIRTVMLKAFATSKATGPSLR